MKGAKKNSNKKDKPLDGAAKKPIYEEAIKDHMDVFGSSIFEKRRIVFLNSLEDDIFSENGEYGEITSKSAEKVYRDILSFYLEDKNKPIYLFIVNNLGGDFYGMLSVYELIENIKKTTPVYTFVFGYAYSAAAFLFLSGSKRFITPQSRLMFHYGKMEIQGDPKATKRWFLESEKIVSLQETMLLQHYRSGLKDKKTKIKEIKNILSSDTVFIGTESVDLGFATDFFDVDVLPKGTI